MSIDALFLTVSDHFFFPGTLAAVNSIFYFHPDARICVVNNNIDKQGLTPEAQQLLTEQGVRIIDAQFFEQPARKLAAWELKAYAACDLSTDHELLIGFDSDLLLCSPIDDIMESAMNSAQWFGGKDGDGIDYDRDYACYGIEIPARNNVYMSTSLYFCPLTAQNRHILALWAEYTNQAEYNGQGNCPGHGDQGVLNAILYRETISKNVSLLPNNLWSQHWSYWKDKVSFTHGQFINESHNNQQQRTFHCANYEKFWERGHIQRIRDGHGDQLMPYAWFLFMLWFGTCRSETLKATRYLTQECWHLLSDVFAFKHLIDTLAPNGMLDWDKLEKMLDPVSLHNS